MTVYTMVVIIVVVTCGTLLALIRGGRPKFDAATDPTILALRDEVQNLKARVETLERIQTDPAERLKRELEDLDG